MVPTVDSIRYNFLLNTLIKAKRPVLLTGLVGTGKTSVVQRILDSLDNNAWTMLTINMSAQVFCLFLLVLEKKHYFQKLFNLLMSKY